MSESPETYLQRMQRLQASSIETNDLNMRIGEQPALAHLATLTTALAVSGTLLELDRKNRLKAILPKSYRGRSFRIPEHIAAIEGIKGVSRTEQPHIRTNVQGSALREHSILPKELGAVLFDKENMQLSSTTIELVTSQQALGPKPQVVRLQATHSGTYEKYIGFELTSNTAAPEEFEGLLKIIQDTETIEKPEDDTFRYVGTATKSTVTTITGNPERHFDFHSQLGVSNEHVTAARQQFNVLATYFEVPFSVAE